MANIISKCIINGINKLLKEGQYGTVEKSKQSP